MLDFQSARKAFESIGVSLSSLEFDILQTGLTSLIGVRNGVYDSCLTKKEFCNILQMENAGRQSVGRRRLVKKLASCFHEFPILSCNLFLTSITNNPRILQSTSVVKGPISLLNPLFNSAVYYFLFTTLKTF